MTYETLIKRVRDGGTVLLDGGTGTELERRGAEMSPGAWCGPASLGNQELLTRVHQDYIDAGADIITANTYASSRVMLQEAGVADRFGEINRAAVAAAKRARDATADRDIVIGGSLSHMAPMVGGSAKPDPARAWSKTALTEAYTELAQLLQDEGCEVILLEMMYDPERIECAFDAAETTDLPIWAGFSARSGDDGRILGFDPYTEVPFETVVDILKRRPVDAAGVMHTPSNIVGDAIEILRKSYDGPLLAYPDSGYFAMPQWQFHDIIAPADFGHYAASWHASGVQILGGCCGLSPEHIAALKPLKTLP